VLDESFLLEKLEAVFGTAEQIDIVIRMS
jgi:hypothetical protein